MTICLDFDGVVHDPYNREEGYRMGKPIKDAKLMMVKLIKDHELIIHSARVQEEKDKEHVEAWLKYFGIPYDFISLTKPKADLYIDDKGMHFKNWEDTVKYIELFERSL